MKDTQIEIKHRKLHKEGYLQKIPAEQGKYAQVCASCGISENNVTNTDLSTDGLLEKILDRNNLNVAYKKVKSNKGASGIDGMEVNELLQYLKENSKILIQSIKDGKYHPQPVRRVEIPKENKQEMRKLGIPTVVDRVVQQAIAQIL